MTETTTKPWPAAIVLEGRHALLRPAVVEDAAALGAAASDGELWNLWYTFVPRPEEMAGVIEHRLSRREAASEWLQFTVIDQASGDVVGSTSYMNIDPVTPRLEIGGTFYAARMQRTALNTECKFMLMRHAFEELGCVAVEYRTHALNTQSRRAIERLGAKLDGVMRNQTRTKDGNLRDTAIYSILVSEWPTVKTHLSWQLERPR